MNPLITMTTTPSSLMAGTGSPESVQFSGEWSSFQAITQIVLTISGGSNFYNGTIVTLYGLP